MEKGKLTNEQSLKIAKKTAKQRERRRRYLKQKHILKAQRRWKTKIKRPRQEIRKQEIRKPQKKKVSLWQRLKNLWYNGIIKIKKLFRAYGKNKTLKKRKN